MQETVLVIEDEETQRDALCTNIFRIYGDGCRVLKAKDGPEGLSLAKMHHPDIALIDINIPGFSGLELIERLYREGFSGRILITTAFDDSEYIRKALSLGVTDYLLKPIARAQLRDAMEKCRESLREDRERERLLQKGRAISSYGQRALLQELLAGQVPRQTLAIALEKEGEEGGMFFTFCFSPALQPETFGSGAVETAQELLLGLFSPYAGVLSGEQEGCLIGILRFPAGQEEGLARARLYTHGRLLLEKTPGSFCFGALRKNLEQLPQALEEVLGMAQGMQGHGLLLKEDAISLFREGSDVAERLVSRWRHRLAEGNATAFVRSFRRRVSEHGDYWGHVGLLILSLAQTDPRANLSSLLEECCQEKPYQEMSRWIEGWEEGFRKGGGVCPLQGDGEYRAYLGGGETPIGREAALAIRFMEEHYQEDLTRQMMAQSLGFNETYFSHLFKRETGKRFVNVLNEIRIAHAIQMIEAGERDMEKVANACGYYGRKYFFEVFRRVKGVSLSEYLQVHDCLEE